MFRLHHVLAVYVAVAIGPACQSGGSVKPPAEQIDVVGVRAELLQIGKAEQSYLARYSRYGTLEELQQDQLLVAPPDRRGYTFAATIDGADAFTVTAAPSDPAKTAWPAFSMDQTLQVTEKPGAQ
jgi:hypothetical protein